MKNEQVYSSRAVVRRIRELREARCYSQEFMAGQMGISQEAYSRLELHETTPSIDRLLSVARILEIPPEELLFAAGS